MEKNIESYVRIKPNFLNKKFCQNTIKNLNRLNAWKKHDWKKYEPQQEQEHVSFSPSGENEPEIITREIPLNDINDFLVPKITKVIEEYINNLKFEWYNSIQASTNLKFIKYSPNQTMKVHCDHIHDIFDGTSKGIPIFSVIGLLNDDYEGGDFVMFGDKKINIKEGDLIIFPSLFLFPHEVKPITKGIRYSYITWLW